MATPAQIGARIRQARKEYQLSLKEVAQAVGVEISTISRYENGAFDRIKLPVLIGIANALHVSPEWLTCKTDNPLGDYGVKPMLDSDGEIDCDEFFRQMVKERNEGREAARDKMLQTHGAEHSTEVLRLINGRTVFMYYHAFEDSRSGSAVMSLAELIERISPAEAEHLELLVSAYYAADERSRQMVDLALDPFLSKEEKEWTGSLVRDDASAEQELAHQILRDKRTGGGSSASNGDAGKKKEA